VHLVGGGALLPHLPILALNVLGRPRVVLGKVAGIQGLPQVMGNPLYTNALGAVKSLHRDMNETAGRATRSAGGFLEKIKKWL
jgi:cell division protein FtsA